MAYYPVTLQQLTYDPEEWASVRTLHAIKVNKTGGGESFSGGADQYHKTLTFEFRWSSVLEDVTYDPQLYRLVYRGHTFNIQDCDDYMEQHRMIKITGVSYG